VRPGRSPHNPNDVAIVHAYSGCFLLANAIEVPLPAEVDYAAETGLVGNDPELLVLTGVASGGVEVEVRHRLDAGFADLEAWEDIAEISFTSTDEAVLVLGPATGIPHPTPLTTSGGSFRLRVSARGRDAEFDLVATHPAHESYLLEVWPDAQASGPVVVRATSKRARSVLG
jgi:hypothetical protein